MTATSDDLAGFFGIGTAGITINSWDIVDEAIAIYDVRPLVEVIEAAIDSPGCGHRISSLVLL